MEYYTLQCSTHIPALKNNRSGVNYRKPKGKESWNYNEVIKLVNMAQISRPSKEVEIVMNTIKNSFRRQMENRGWQPILKPTFVFCVYELGVYYDKYPKSDVDNMVTTIQECLENTVLENDVQVRGSLQVTWKTATTTSECFRLWVFPTKDLPDFWFAQEALNTVIKV